jgi:hypothetical protein
MARQLLCAWIWFLILAYPPGVKGAAAGDNEVVAFAGAGSIGAAVLANGDLYLLGQRETAWAYQTNVFAATGASSAGRAIVGMIGAPGLTVLASDGTLFNGIYMATQWAVIGNIWTSAGMSPDGDTFVVLGSEEGTEVVHAATAFGRTFRRIGGSSPWEYTGTLATGPTAVQRDTWGSLKVRYR